MWICAWSPALSEEHGLRVLGDTRQGNNRKMEKIK
jgi:hypothetical protein